jgi:hypothetical protein
MTLYGIEPATFKHIQKYVLYRFILYIGIKRNIPQQEGNVSGVEEGFCLTQLITSREVSGWEAALLQSIQNRVRVNKQRRSNYSVLTTPRNISPCSIYVLSAELSWSLNSPGNKCKSSHQHCITIITPDSTDS